MKEKLSIEKIMHFIVHNGFMFTVAVMGLVHVTLLGILLYAGVTALVSLNTISVIVYLFCVLLCRFGHIMPVYISILLEVTIYSVLSTYYIGWDCGSWCFLCSIVPIILYFGCFLFKGVKRWNLVLILMLHFATYVVLYLRFVDTPPAVEVTNAVRNVLMIFSSFVMIFSMIFYTTLYIYSSEVEMSSLTKRNEQLSTDAHIDLLTNALNRRGFLPIVKSLMEDDKQIKHFCIAFLDIDNFKRINDSYGHDCGDEVLRHISEIVKKEMSGCDICRWGGEEFVILLKDYDFPVAKEKMEYIRRFVESTPTSFYNKRISATITIGLEKYSEDYHEPEAMIKVADGRMYYGKQHGKNIVISEDPDEKNDTQ